jgi:2,3-bisphosphoglycerate-independent phosphoglycerate mutase
MAVEAVDLQIGRLMRFVKKANGALLVTADHGNADEMYEHDKHQNLIRGDKGELRVKTSHTLNPVPLHLYAPQAGPVAFSSTVSKPGLSNIAATTMQLLGFDVPENFEPSLLS